MNVFTSPTRRDTSLTRRKASSGVDEAWGEIELVVGAWGQAPKVRNVIARHAHLALAPVEPIAAFEISHEAPCVERFSSDTIKCLCVRRSRCGQDRQGIDAGAKT